MAPKRAHVVMPEELLEEIDRHVGKRGRSRFLQIAARAQLKRLKQLQSLERAAGAWKKELHPELDRGAAAYVRTIRREEAASRRKRKR